MSSVLMHTVVDDDDEVVNRVVLPKGRRRMILELAHDKWCEKDERGNQQVVYMVRYGK